MEQNQENNNPYRPPPRELAGQSHTISTPILFRPRFLFAATAITISICAMAPPAFLLFMQIFILDQQQYASFVLNLVENHFYVLALPGLLGTIVWVATLIDAFQHQRENLRSAIPLFAALFLLNIIAVMCYWLHEIRICLRGPKMPTIVCDEAKKSIMADEPDGA